MRSNYNIPKLLNKDLNTHIKKIQFLDDDNETLHEEPIDFKTEKDFPHLKGEGIFDNIKKIFPVIGLLSNLISPKKIDIPPEAKDDDDIHGGFISSILPLIMETLPGVISGFKGLFTGKGLMHHGKNIHGFHDKNEHYVNPIKFGNQIFKEIHKLNPSIKKYKYKVKLFDGDEMVFDDNIDIPLKKNQLHLFKYAFGGKGISRGIGSGISRGFDQNAKYSNQYKNVGEI